MNSFDILNKGLFLFFFLTFYLVLRYESESHSVMSNSLDPMDYTLHAILQARILEWVAFAFSRESSQPRDQTQVTD